MCKRQASLMQQAFARKKEGDGDAVSCSTDTSRWSSPPRLGCGSNSLRYTSDFEDQADSLIDKSPGHNSSDKWQGPKPERRKKDKKAQGPHRQKTNCTAGRQVLKLPPIKSLQASKTRIQSAHLSCIRELKSQVWDLQQQLTEARTENKLLKRLQHRHTMALQHFQDSEGSLSQILTKHNNEARVLQGLLRETRSCRDSLARQLQATENKLLSSKASLQHLQLLSQDRSLLEREELTLRLTRATAELGEKGKRIVDLEKNLELCRASFNRQIVTEQRKIQEARKISCFLQEQIYQLSRDIQDRERELETHNIYSHRFLKGFTKKGGDSKMVQTDGLVLLPTHAASVLELKYTETETEEGLKEQFSANVTIEKNPQEDTETCADTSEESSCSEESPEQQTGTDCPEEKEASEAPWVLEKEQKTEEHESDVTYILQNSLNTTEPKRKGYKLPKIRRNDIFKQSTENRHSVSFQCCYSPLQEALVIEKVTEFSANVTLEENHQEDTESYTREQSRCSEESPEHQTGRDYPEEKEASEAPWVLEEKRKTEEHESEPFYILEKSLNTTEPRRKEYKLPKTRRHYNFKPSIENLHNGRPAYSSGVLNPHETTQSTIRVETLSSGICEFRLPAGKSRRGGVGSPQCE